MGQAVADLPNSLDAPPPASLSGTDDLLAQLAGDEIDRLLAQTDVERLATRPVIARTEPPAPAATVIHTPDAKPATPPGNELDALLSELNDSGGIAAVPPGESPRSRVEQAPDVLAQLAVGPLRAGGNVTGRPPAPAAGVIDGVMSAEEREALSLSN